MFNKFDSCRQLEDSLSLMSSEFESMKKYSQTKLKEERGFYEDQLLSNEEQFSELEQRMKEYEKLLLATDRSNKHKHPDNDSDQLYIIEERREEEEQVNVCEQEILELRKEIEKMEELHKREISLIKNTVDRNNENHVIKHVDEMCCKSLLEKNM